MQSLLSVPSHTPPFTLETVLDLLGGTTGFVYGLGHQGNRRDDLSRRFSTVATRQQSPELPPPTTEIIMAWNRVHNMEVLGEAQRDTTQAFLMQSPQTAMKFSGMSNLQCKNPKLIAVALRDFLKTSKQKFAPAMQRLAVHGSLSTAFGLQMAKLIGESLRLHEDPNEAKGARLRICEIEVAQVKQSWVYGHNGNGPCRHVGVQEQSRIVFISTLYKYGVATPSEYAQVLKWLALGGQPCICRLQGLQIVVGSGNRDVHSLCTHDVCLVLDALRATDPQGNRIWELNGHPTACEFLQRLDEIQSKVQCWRET